MEAEYRNYTPYTPPPIAPVTFSDILAQNNVIVPDVNADAQPDGKAWNIIDKIFGYGQTGADIYTQIQTGEKPYYSAYGANYMYGQDYYEKDWTGMRKPWGTIAVLSIASVVGFAIYKMSKN